MKTLLRYTILPIIIVLLIFIGTCIIQPSDIPDMPEGFQWDKLVHFGMFFLLSGVSMYDYFRLHDGSPNIFRWIFWGFVLPVIYGAVIELLQENFFSRSAEIRDWYADILGSLTATVLAIIILRKRSNKGNNKRKNLSL